MKGLMGMLGIDEKEMSKTLDGFGALFSDIAVLKARIEEVGGMLESVLEKLEKLEDREERK